MKWTITDAQNRLSEVLHQADREAQVIEQDDREYLVVRRERHAEAPNNGDAFIRWLLSAPKVEGFEPMPRNHAPMRQVDL